MMTDVADFSAIAVLKFLDDAVLKMSNHDRNPTKKKLSDSLFKLSYDLFHSLPSRNKNNVALYSLLDPRFSRLKNMATSLKLVMLKKDASCLTPEILSQILNLTIETLPHPKYDLVAIVLSQSIDKNLLSGGKFNPLHSANLMYAGCNLDPSFTKKWLP